MTVATAPQPPKARLTELRSNLQSALKHLGPAIAMVWRSGRRSTVALLAVSLVSSLLPVGQAYLGKLIVDSVLRSVSSGLPAMEGLRATSPYLAAEFGLILLGTILNQLRRLCTDLLNQKLGQTVARQLMEKAARLELYYFETPEFYDKLQSARRETEFRAIALMNNGVLLLQNLVTLLSFALPILYFSPWIALVLFGSTLPAFVAQTRFSRLSFRLHSWRAPEARRMSYYELLLTQDTSAKEIRLFGLADPIVARHQALFERVFAEDRKLAVRRSGASVLWGAVASLSFYACYAWTVFRTVARAISLGQMTFLLSSFRQLQGTFAGIFDNLNSLYENGLFMQNLFAVLELPERDVRAGARVQAVLESERAAGIEFRKVSFRYPGGENWALREVSLRIAAGEKLALVGENGSGKTTLIKLLTGLYAPTEGEILLYGRKLTEYSEAELHAKVGVIFQDFVRYQSTLRDNVGFGSIETMGEDPASDGEKPSAEGLRRLERAGRLGGASELLDELPEGWDAMLGGWFSKGRELSGGQWQKVALSRAFMREAEILILDEPTSALDAAKEHEIFARFKELTAGKIAILVSHRFSTVRMADQIVVLRHGRIEESGSHPELMARGGSYARLFELQAEGYR